MSSQARRPRVLLVGGPDVDARADLMLALRDHFDLAAAGSAPPPIAKLTKHHFRYFHYPLHPLVAPIGDLRAMQALRRIVSAFQPDVVHAFDSKPTVLARLVAHEMAVPAVVGTLPGLGRMYATEAPRSLGLRAVRRAYELAQRRASRAPAIMTSSPISTPPVQMIWTDRPRNTRLPHRSLSGRRICVCSATSMANAPGTTES